MSSFLKSAGKYFLWIVIPILILAACLAYLMWVSSEDSSAPGYQIF